MCWAFVGHIPGSSFLDNSHTIPTACAISLGLGYWAACFELGVPGKVAMAPRRSAEKETRAQTVQMC
jgi:hypothetical protein